MSDERPAHDELSRAVARIRASEDRAGMRALVVIMLDMAAIIRRHHPEEFDHVLGTCRLEFQTLRDRRRRQPFRGATRMWEWVVELLERVPAQQAHFWGRGPSQR